LSAELIKAADKIETLEAENARLKQENSKWFEKGRESVLRDNRSGCCCKFDEDESELLEPCLLHKEWAEKEVRQIKCENQRLETDKTELESENKWLRHLNEALIAGIRTSRELRQKLPIADLTPITDEFEKKLKEREDAIRHLSKQLDKKRAEKAELVEALTLCKNSIKVACKDVDGCPFDCHGLDCEECVHAEAEKKINTLLGRVKEE